MSNSFNHPNLSEQFKKAVSDGLSTGDFSDLNILVTDTVSDVISEAGKQVRNVSSSTYQKSFKIYEGAKEYEEAQRQRNENFKKNYNTSGHLKPGYSFYTKPTLPATKTKNVGQVSSILYMVFGGLGVGTSIAVFFAMFIIALVSGSWSAPLLAFLAVLGTGSALMLHKGITEKNRLSRMKRYLALFADKMYVNISDLAQSLGKSTKYILKDVKKMISLGFFPEGHLDKKETCLMLDDTTYREYLRLEKERNVYEQEQKNASAQNEKSTKPDTAAENTHHSQTKTEKTNPELQTMIREGHDYIRRLHELNDLIPGEVISEKLYRMENLLKEIFKRLEEDPSQMPQLHKLMNYYLPTTIKLLQSYSEFDDISSPGIEIVKAKAEIEKTVDTINEAFSELLNKIFQSAVFDATTDAQVLQTMLAKEGLTKNDFSGNKAK